MPQMCLHGKNKFSILKQAGGNKFILARHNRAGLQAPVIQRMKVTPNPEQYEILNVLTFEIEGFGSHGPGALRCYFRPIGAARSSCGTLRYWV